MHPPGPRKASLTSKDTQRERSRYPPMHQPRDGIESNPTQPACMHVPETTLQKWWRYRGRAVECLSSALLSRGGLSPAGRTLRWRD